MRFDIEAVQLVPDAPLELWVHDMECDGFPVVFHCKEEHAAGLAEDFINTKSPYISAIGREMKIFLDRLYSEC